MFKVPEDCRVTFGTMRSTKEDGNNGAFQVPYNSRRLAIMVVSDGEGWEHVSVRMYDRLKKTNHTPTWSEMCWVKDIFWDTEDCVIQFHPPKSEYVNNHVNVLHLWRPTEQQIPRPDNILVGFK